MLYSTAGIARPGDVARPPPDVFARALRLALPGGAFVLSLAWTWGGVDRFVLPKLAAAQLVVACLLGLLLGRWLRAGALTLRRTPLDLPLLAFVASAGVSTALSVNRTVAVFGTYMRYEGLLTIATYAALFWLGVQVLTSAADVRQLVRSFLAAAYVASVLAVLQSVLATAAAGGGTADTLTSSGGWVRATLPFGNATLLGIYLAMLLPLAVFELRRAGSVLGCVLWANVTFTMALALVLTFSRSAWLGGIVGLVVVVARSLPGLRRRRPAILMGAAVLLLIAGAAGAGAGRASLVRAVAARAATLADPAAGSSATRLRIWGDTLDMVAARPVTGWGPDTFGLVYPRFQTGTWAPGSHIDRAHSDILEVAATQGLVGVTAYVWLLGAIAVAFWRGRRHAGAFAMAAVMLAYELPVQVNFAWAPVTAPFWVLAAAAVVTWTPDRDGPRTRSVVLRLDGAGMVAASGAALALPALLVALLVVRPLLADAAALRGLVAQARGDADGARAALVQARELAPEESAYAEETGDAELDLTPDGLPGARARWAPARSAYEDAIGLGATGPLVYERLALVDRALGRAGEADAAARTAVNLASKQ